MMTRNRTPFALAAPVAMAALCALSACMSTAPPASGPAIPVDIGGEIIIPGSDALPKDARPGACYGRDKRPATIEVVTESVQVAPAQYAPNGNILTPAKYETHKEQRVIGGEVIYFETPCPPAWTPDFIASIQRALKVRGIYGGAISGSLDEATRKAIRQFQLGFGLNSEILSTENARRLGLVAIDLG